MDKTVKQAHLHYRWLKNKQVPWLNLTGSWLEKMGFPIGQKVEIEIEEEKLVIKAVK